MVRNQRIGYLLLALAITLACVPVLPSVAPLPTQAVGAVDTIVAGTYAAASTGTAVKVSATPTLRDTLTPSRTPTVTPTATATVIFKTPTLFSVGGGGGSSGGGSSGGGSSGGGTPTINYSCKILKTSPTPGSRMPRGKNFKTTWILANTSNVAWDRNSVDYLYQGGTPMHTQSLYDLPMNVAPNRQVELTVSMQAPKTRGTFTTNWTLRIGDEYFCTMEQTIVTN